MCYPISASSSPTNRRTAALSASGASPDFEQSVAPILMRRCLGCHSGAAAKGGESGEAIVGGEPDDSLLWQFVESGEMPPDKSLPDAERQILREWIAAGAPWSGGPLDPLKFSSDTCAGRNWWSLKPVQPIVPPAAQTLKSPARVRNPRDAFVLAKLEAGGLTLSAEADPRTLARRLYVDLVGLPPEPEEVAALVADPSEAARMCNNRPCFFVADKAYPRACCRARGFFDGGERVPMGAQFGAKTTG